METARLTSPPRWSRMKASFLGNIPEKWRVLAAIGLWAFATSLLYFASDGRTVTPLYHQSAENWRARQPLYEGPVGMNYFPHFAVLFTPFHVLPAPLGEVLWRCCAVILFTTGLWRVVRLQFGENSAGPFLWASLIALSLSLDALRSGQANAHLSGLLLHAMAYLAERRWWATAVCLGFALAVKPLALVVLLLAPAVYVPLRWRMAVVVAAFAVLPFAFAPADYVLGQYQQALTNLRACAAVTEHRFADVNGIVRTFGGQLPQHALMPVRVMAGLLTLGLCLACTRSSIQPTQAMSLHALAAVYLMLFNPMTEVNSYVILAPALAFWAVSPAMAPRYRWSVVGLALSMGLLPEMLWGLVGNSFALLWHPAMTVVFATMIVRVHWPARRTAAIVNA